MNETDDRRIDPLEFALAEEVAGLTPPDLSQAILGHCNANAQPRIEPRAGAWRTAALLLAGCATIAFAFWTTQTVDPQTAGSDSGPNQQSRATSDPKGPRDFVEFRTWLREMPMHVVSVLAAGVHDVSSGSYVPFFPTGPAPTIHKLAQMDFVSITGTRRVHAIREALLNAAVTPPISATRPAEHILRLTHRDRQLQVGIVGLGRYPFSDVRDADVQYFILGRDGPIPIAVEYRFLERLHPKALMDRSEQMLRDLGIAVGDAGIDWLERNSKRLRCVGVTSRALPVLSEFVELESIDISASPDLHDAAALAAISSDRLHALVVDGTELSNATAKSIHRFANLRGLFLLESRRATLADRARVIGVDDDVVADWAQRLTGLETLHLHGAQVMDAGVASLAELRELTTLFLLDCAEIRGTTLGELKVQELRISAGTANLAAIRDIAGLRRLTVFGPTKPQEPWALVANESLDSIAFVDNRAIDDATIEGLLPALREHGVQFLFIECPRITAASCARWERLTSDGCEFRYVPPRTR